MSGLVSELSSHEAELGRPEAAWAQTETLAAPAAGRPCWRHQVGPEEPGAAASDTRAVAVGGWGLQFHLAAAAAESIGGANLWREREDELARPPFRPASPTGRRS